MNCCSTSPSATNVNCYCRQNADSVPVARLEKFISLNFVARNAIWHLMIKILAPKLDWTIIQCISNYQPEKRHNIVQSLKDYKEKSIFFKFPKTLKSGQFLRQTADRRPCNSFNQILNDIQTTTADPAQLSIPKMECRVSERRSKSTVKSFEKWKLTHIWRFQWRNWCSPPSKH